MTYSLTNEQKALLQWIIKQRNNGSLNERFMVRSIRVSGTPIIENFNASIPGEIEKYITKDRHLDELVYAEMLRHRKVVLGDEYRLTQRAFEAVASNFNTQDASFIRHLTPLADLSGFDQELKERCLPILGAGNDPKHWDTAVRQAFLILEERLRSVSSIPASEKNTSENLVNKVFGDATSLILDNKEKTAYRNLYSGMFTVFRNEYGHRFVDPSPDDGGAIITFINLLLKMLEDLRPTSGS